MNTSQILLLDKSQAKGSPSPNRARLFYSGAAALLLGLMILGFQAFYLHGKAYPNRELIPTIRTLLILHGTGMSAWVLLFLIQPLLIVADNRRVHMMLGKIGAVLAAGIVILGWQLGIESTLISPPHLRIWGLAPKQFMAVPIISIMIFAGFVIVGVWKRRRQEAHRSMMLLATLAAMPAAVSRIGVINNLYQSTVWETVFGPFFGTLVVGLFFPVHEVATDAIVEPVVCDGVCRTCRFQRADHAGGDDQCMGSLCELPASLMSSQEGARAVSRSNENQSDIFIQVVVLL